MLGFEIDTMSIMVYADDEQQKAYQRQYYLDNKTKRIAVAAAASKKHRAKISAAAREAKSVPCKDCGVQYPFYVMQFDHVRGEKKFTIATIGRTYISMKDLQEEIAKCEVVCANCHCARTYIRRTMVIPSDPAGEGADLISR